MQSGHVKNLGNERKDVIVIGAALFAMFFGAGNLIFPPAIGLASGSEWVMSLLGFLVTGIGLPVLGVLAVSKAGGTIFQFAGKVNSTFGKIFATIVILAIGPLLAIPRTGATVYEIGIKPMFPTVSPLLVAAIYFTITWIFVIKPSGVIDKVGKILTPVLLAILALVISCGVFKPMGAVAHMGLTNPFSFGFLSGYQTMDTLGSIVMGGLILNALLEKGYTKPKDQMRLTMKAGLIAGACLGLVYGGLLFLGASGSMVFASDIARTDLVIGITNKVLGSFGQIGMCVAVSAACLTTSIGLTAIVGDFFENLSEGKLQYKYIVTFTCLFSVGVAVLGVEQIVKVAVPLLVLVYPIAITLILMNMMSGYIKYESAYKGAALGAFIVGLYDALTALNINMGGVKVAFDSLPFASNGFAWVVPTVVLGILFAATECIFEGRKNQMLESVND